MKAVKKPLKCDDEWEREQKARKIMIEKFRRAVRHLKDHEARKKGLLKKK